MEETKDILEESVKTILETRKTPIGQRYTRRKDLQTEERLPEKRLIKIIDELYDKLISQIKHHLLSKVNNLAKASITLILADKVKRGVQEL